MTSGPSAESFVFCKCVHVFFFFPALQCLFYSTSSILLADQIFPLMVKQSPLEWAPWGNKAQDRNNLWSQTVFYNLSDVTAAGIIGAVGWLRPEAWRWPLHGLGWHSCVSVTRSHCFSSAFVPGLQSFGGIYLWQMQGKWIFYLWILNRNVYKYWKELKQITSVLDRNCSQQKNIEHVRAAVKHLISYFVPLRRQLAPRGLNCIMWHYLAV